MAAWPRKQFGELADVCRGSSPRPIADTKYSEGGTIPWVKIADATRSGKFIRDTAEYVNEYGASFSRYLPEGTILVAASGVTLGFATILGIKGCAHDGWLILQNLRGLDRDFAYYYLKLIEAQFHNSSSGAAIQNINTDILRKTEIPYPPLPVQRHIARILAAYDELIENSHRRIGLLEAIASALYREWFVYHRFPGHEKIQRVASPLGDIPKGWEIASLSALVDFAKGRKPAETRQEPLSGDVKLLLIDSLHGGAAAFTSPAKLVLAEMRDTIMVMDGASSCEVTIGSCGAVGSTLGRFRTTRPNSFSSHALYRFLEAKTEEFKSKNIGAAIPHANKDYILTQQVALPPKAIACSFHAQLEPIQRTIETLHLQIQNLRHTRDLLLSRLLSGQIDVGPLTMSPNGHHNALDTQDGTRS